MNRIVHGLPLTEAITAPRWPFDLAGDILVESSMPKASLCALIQAGITPTQMQGASPFFGSAEVIEVIEGNVLVGAADARREAMVLGA